MLVKYPSVLVGHRAYWIDIVRYMLSTYLLMRDMQMRGRHNIAACASAYISTL